MSLTNSPFWFSSGATSAGGGGTVVYPYSIDQSLRLDGTSAYLTKNDFGTATDTAKRTFSTWVKRGDTVGVGAYNHIISAGSSAIDGFGFANGTAKLQWLQGGLVTKDGVRDLRDTIAWYHIFTTWNATDNEVYIYVNGELDYSSTGSISALSKLGNTGHTTYIGKRSNAGVYIHGYLAETVFLDGTIGNVNDFGELVNGIWVPKDISAASLTYGTNGFYLDYADSSDLGKDVSGQSNHFTSNNLAAEDQVPDSPTNNWCTLNLLDTSGSSSLFEGNLNWRETNYYKCFSTMVIPEISDTDTYYAEVCLLQEGYGVGIAPLSNSGSANNTSTTGFLAFYSNGNFYNGGTTTPSGYDPVVGDIISIKAGNGQIEFFLNGTSVGTPYTSLTGSYKFGAWSAGAAGTGIYWNFGQDSSFANQKTTGSSNTTDQNGFGDFYYAEAANNISLCTANIAAPAIGPQLASGQQSDNYFEPILYTGSGATQHIGSGGAQHPIDVITVGNSCRFNSSDSARFNNSTRPAGDRQQFTISFWFKLSKLGVQRQFFEGAMDSGQGFFVSFNPSNQLYLYDYNVASGGFQIYGGKAYTDTSKWYNMVIAVDTPQATNSDRIKIWVDNEQIDLSAFTVGAGASAWPDQNSSFNWNSGGNTSIGYGNSSYWDGYLAEFVHIEGSVLDPTSFGQYGSNGYWIPKDVSGLTFGDEGFYLDFSDNSTASALGTDSSVNGNNFSATNISKDDQMGDSPTQNFNIFDRNNCYSSGSRLSEGNLRYTHDGANGHHTTTLAFNSSGNWYWEVGLTNSTSVWLGIVDANQSCRGSGSINGYFWYPGNGYISTNPYVSQSAWSTGVSAGDIIGFQINNGVMTIYQNGVSLGNPFTIPINGYYRPFAMSPGAASGISTFNFGADDSFAGSETPSSGAQAADANGYGSFYYTPPTGALAIVDDNIPVEGITSPDFTWIKSRSSTYNNVLWDTVRGATKQLSSNTSGAESTQTSGLTSFDYDGFTIGSNSNLNNSGSTYVSWNWKASGNANTFNIDGTGYASIAASPISDGTIPLTGLSANTTSGFSIVGYTGNGTGGSTIAHGLSETPEMIIVKSRSAAEGWVVYTEPTGNTGFLNLNGTGAFATSSGEWNNTSPTSTVFTVGTQGRVNTNTKDYIAYCFHSVDGFSKVGSYVGNASTDGTFVYTGFRPAWVMIKNTADVTHWAIWDSKRVGYNVITTALYPSSSDADQTGTSLYVDFVSNGFKWRSSHNSVNGNNDTFIYLAFAEQPFKYANAR